MRTHSLRACLQKGIQNLSLASRKFSVWDEKWHFIPRLGIIKPPFLPSRFFPFLSSLTPQCHHFLAASHTHMCSSTADLILFHKKGRFIFEGRKRKKNLWCVRRSYNACYCFTSLRSNQNQVLPAPPTFAISNQNPCWLPRPPPRLLVTTAPNCPYIALTLWNSRLVADLYQLSVL